ncbi:MAG: tetratricopeptide repeat protein [Verrucomicrobiota bacterium]
MAITSFATSTNEIANAVRDLGASDHKTREAATQFLSTAGKAAVPELEKAAKSSDPEIRLRAAELLPAARLGLPADFPAEVRTALSEYPKAGNAEKAATVARLAQLGRPARGIIIELAQAEPNLETRIAVFGQLLEPVGEELERRLKEDKLDDEAVAHISEGLEFTQALVPEIGVELVPRFIQRFDKVGQKKAATDLFDCTYRQLDKLCLESPKDPERHNNVAWLCAVARRRLDDGLKHIEQALAETPNAPALLDTQAELYFQKGNKEKALELMEKAIERDPNMPYFRQQLERIKKGDPSVPPPEPEMQ